MKIRAALIAAVLSWSWGTLAAGSEIADSGEFSAGRKLYLEGMRDDGVPLVAERAGGLTVVGAQAACVNCHRRSGFGGSEGRSYIPPVNARSLFEAKLPGTGASASGMGRPAYTDEALAQAIRYGIDPAGRQLDYLMPRYALTDAQAKSLIAYLRELSAPPAAGVDSDALDFATVLAPGVARERGKAMLEVLNACFEEHNAGPLPARGRKRLAPDVRIGVQRKWRLQVWELAGKPETWPAQLAEHARRKPVFAMVGGLGGGNWAPVHEFCERNGLPCLFPSVENPITGETGSYAMYLSRGILMEAAIVARDLVEQTQGVGRVIQVLRADDDGARAGAQALRLTLATRGIEVHDRRLEPMARLDARTVETTSGADALVLWLRADDLKALESISPASSRVYISATLAGSERTPLAAAWKERAFMAYPFELPQNRQARMARMRAWLHAHGVSPADEAVQADAYIACSALGAAMNEVADHLQPDYLVERLEAIVERGVFAGSYPRLALGTGQRFASKTGYLVRFARPESADIVPVGELIAP